MRARGLIAAAVLGAALLASSRASAEDDWFGRDKALHFGVSVGLAAGAYAGASLLVERRAERAAAGADVSLALGAGKELADLAGHGDPSWKDFTWDVAGTALGVGLALAVDLALGGGAGESSSRRVAPLTVSF